LPTDEAILDAICEDVRKRMARELQRASSVEEACRHYLLFAQRHPHEYELLMQSQLEQCSGFRLSRTQCF